MMAPSTQPSVSSAYVKRGCPILRCFLAKGGRLCLCPVSTPAINNPSTRGSPGVPSIAYFAMGGMQNTGCPILRCFLAKGGRLCLCPVSTPAINNPSTRGSPHAPPPHSQVRQKSVFAFTRSVENRTKCRREPHEVLTTHGRTHPAASPAPPPRTARSAPAPSTIFPSHHPPRSAPPASGSPAQSPAECPQSGA
jgi:hypothetical protein